MLVASRIIPLRFAHRQNKSGAASHRDGRNKAITASRDIDNEPIPIASVTQRAAHCRNMDSKVGRLDK